MSSAGHPPTLSDIAAKIRNGEIKNIVTLVGAGISTAAGIPDFRSRASGIYDNLEEFHLPDPMAVFSLDYFQTNPRPFFEVARRLYNPKVKPTLTHYFIRLLNDKERLQRHYTQDFSACDLLLIIGTSLQVQPFCSLLHRVRGNVPRFYLNGEFSPNTQSGFIAFIMRFMVAGLRRNPFQWGQSGNRRDVFVQGDADASILQLAELLGWKDELSSLKKNHDAYLETIQNDSLPTIGEHVLTM